MNEIVIGIIPARLGSSRFPGKPLAMLGGKSLLQRTYKNACSASALEQVMIATDDSRIQEHAEGFGASVLITSKECKNGTERLAEVIQKGHHADASIIVNVQGDEPFLEPQVIDQVVEVLQSHPDAVCATAIMKLWEEEEARSSTVVKCVTDLEGKALYFSRALIPSNHQNIFSPPYYKHLGIYAYRREFLHAYPNLPATPLMLAEDLEQLKILENGYQIQTIVVESQSVGIDTEEDLRLAHQRLL